MPPVAMCPSTSYLPRRTPRRASFGCGGLGFEDMNAPGSRDPVVSGTARPPRLVLPAAVATSPLYHLTANRATSVLGRGLGRAAGASSIPHADVCGDAFQ